MKRTIYGMALAMLLALAGAAAAEDFPARPMTMVISFAAGGPTDLLGRVIAARMGAFSVRPWWSKMSVAPAA